VEQGGAGMVAEPRCPACGGSGSSFPEDYDVVNKMEITRHDICWPCRGTGRVLPLAPRPAPAGQERLEGV